MGSAIVRGSASTTVAPDRVIISLQVTHVAGDPGAAVEEVTRRAAALAATLTERGVDRADWTTEALRVAEEWEYRDGNNVRVGDRADAGISVTVRALDTVGELITAAVHAGAGVRSLDWQVDEANPVRRQLLIDAARDARLRADAYAEALGRAVGDVELISEEPIGQPGGPGPVPMMVRSAKADAAAMDVNPGQLRLTAEVSVRFALVG